LVYDEAVLLVAPLRVPRDAAGEARFQASVTWVACKDRCLPGRADLALRLPVDDAPPTADPRSAPVFSRAADLLPRPLGAVPAQAEADRDRIRLTFHHGGAWEREGLTAHFFPEEWNVVAFAADPRLAAGGGRLTLDLARAEPGASLPERLRGVLRLDSARGVEAFALDLPLGGGAGASPPASPEGPSHAWWAVPLAALLGAAAVYRRRSGRRPPLKQETP
jgi:thiol:disulfide interchange protein DsbD